MSEKYIEELEKLLKNYDLDADKTIQLLKHPKVHEELDKIFKSKEIVSVEQIENLDYSDQMKGLLELYLSENSNSMNYGDLHTFNRKYSDIAATQYFNEISKIPLFTAEEEKNMFIKYHNATSEEEKKEIKDKIAKANLRFM